MAGPARVYISQDEFFEFLKSAEGRWELVDGENKHDGWRQPAPPRGRGEHARRAPHAVAGELMPSDGADTAVMTNGNVRYPDVVVDCGKRDDQAMSATSPTLVIEVLSQSTRLFDSHKKLNEYKSHRIFNMSCSSIPTWRALFSIIGTPGHGANGSMRVLTT